MRVTDAMFMGTKKHSAHDGNPLHLEVQEVQATQLKQGLTTKSVLDVLILL